MATTRYHDGGHVSSNMTKAMRKGIPCVIATVFIVILVTNPEPFSHARQSSDRIGSCPRPMTCAPVSPAVRLGPPKPAAATSHQFEAPPLLLAKTEAALSSFEATPTKMPEKKRWSSFLPLMAEEATKRGYRLPLPFGIGAVFTGLVNRDIDVTDVRVGVNGARPQSVKRFVNFGTTSTVFNANVKLDAWLLPFLNVYFLAGYVNNETTIRADITVTRPGPIPGDFEFTKNIKTHLEGFVGGGGMTLVGGYRDFFFVGDANYTQTDMGFDDRFKAFIATIRAGYQTKLRDVPLQVWIGQGYWETTNTAKGHADVPGVGRIEFEADQGPIYPWMTDFGANLAITKEFGAVLDFGTDWHGGYLFVVTPTYRF
ncbi:MAG: hypothetical protein R3B74_06220 [Nitrospirales bacterium]|nr:hypothetical protein [Nitrospirales bacterium]